MMVRLMTLILTCCLVSNVKAQPRLSFYQYVKQLESQLIAGGSDAAKTKQAFDKIKLFKKAVVVQQRERKKVKTLDTFLPRLVNEQRVKRARTFYKENLPLLKEIEKKYNIQPRFLVAMWGVANDFSDTVDGYNALSVLSSLAYANQQDDTYQQQIQATINLLNTPALGIDEIKSNWAGKVGLFNLEVSQYLSSFQDYNQDGKADIWRSKDDSFATMAKYLADSGWERKYTWGRQVKLPKDFDVNLLKGSEYKSLTQWNKLGVTRFDSRALPNALLMAKLVAPDGVKGRVYLTYHNFEHIVEVTDSLYNAIAVGYLSNRIKYPPIQ